MDKYRYRVLTKLRYVKNSFKTRKHNNGYARFKATWPIYVFFIYGML